MSWKLILASFALVLGLAQETNCSDRECPVNGSSSSSSLLQSKFSNKKKELSLAEDLPQEEKANDEELDAATAELTAEFGAATGEAAAKAMHMSRSHSQMSMVQAQAMTSEEEAALLKVQEEEKQMPAKQIPFYVPFNTTAYTGGSFNATSADGKSGAIVYWRMDTKKLYLGMSANAGFVGFGMNRRGPGMRNADIVVCREHAAGIISAADYHSTGNRAPDLDPVQDWTTHAGGRATPPPPPTMPPNACPPGYTFGANTCFKLVRDRKMRVLTAVQAKAACAAEGAQLAKIETPQQQSILESMVPSSEHVGIWIGARKIKGKPNEFQFQWGDGSPITYQRWGYKEPGTFYSQGVPNYDCAWMAKWDKKWYTGPCRRSRFGWRAGGRTHVLSGLAYACSKPLASTVPEQPPAAYNSRPVTWCEISRSRKTCERKEDMQLENVDFGLYGLLAWSSERAATDELSYHGPTHRRTFPFSFVDSPAAGAGGSGGSGGGGNSIPKDAQVFRLNAPSVWVPTTSGSFACSYHVLPVPKKMHIVNFKARYSSNSPSNKAGLQHHVDMNSCTQAIPGAKDGGHIPCAQTMQHCSSILLSGGTMYSQNGDTLPSDAGIPIGGDGTRYVVISKHFYNPTGRESVADVGTHFIITYTPTLRPFEWRQITFTTSHFKVPPQTFGHVVQSWCPGSCTRGLEVDTQVRTVGFHMHGNAKRGTLRHIRNGVELEPIGEVDPWVQAQAGYQVKRSIKPGDDLILECVYDNSASSTPLTAGEAINQEMCVGTMGVVGRGKFALCSDMAWGIKAPLPTACYNPRTGRPYPVKDCNFSIPRTYCPNRREKKKMVIWDEADRSRPFKQFNSNSSENCSGAGSGRIFVPAVPGSCKRQLGNKLTPSSVSPSSDSGKMPLSERTDESTESQMVSSAANSHIIQGEKDCGMGRTDFRVSWKTDCTKKRITFEMESRVGPGGWIGFGIHDAGTATAKVPFPAEKMRGADIVQGSAGLNYIKDSKAVGYTTPIQKGKPGAELVSKKYVNGKTVVTYTRPFDSQEGVSIKEDRFVYLICAVRHCPTCILQSTRVQQRTLYECPFLAVFQNLGDSFELFQSGPS